jgi:hypothetical protein
VDKKLKKRFQPKKSVSIRELKKQVEGVNVQALPARLPAKEGRLSFVLACDECKFEMKSGDKIRLIEDLREKRVVCEICFENLNISDWRFVDRSRFNY